MNTRTGTFRVGMTVGTSAWQRDLPSLTGWANDSGFAFLDLGSATAADVRAVHAAGMEVVAVGLLDSTALLSHDSGRRREAVTRNAARLRELGGLEVGVFAVTAAPDDPGRSVSKNFDLAVASFGELGSIAESLGSVIVLEGYPGSPPDYPNLCCNPEQCRAILRAVPGKGLGLVYDPAHLIRMGIDHCRFLDEFGTHIGHVHARDTEILTDFVYEVGALQRPLTDPPPETDGVTWRYTIPGQGIARWGYILRTLQLAGYKGSVSVVLEDSNFAGTEQAEKAGLLAGMTYLHSV